MIEHRIVKRPSQPKVIDRIGILSNTRGLIHRSLLLWRSLLLGWMGHCYRLDLLRFMNLGNSRLLPLILPLCKRMGSWREIRL